jgi:hypothetical protein
MHLQVFLFANHDRLRSRRTGRGHMMLEIMGAAPITFGDATHSKGDPNTTHLTFTKVQVWGRMVRLSPKGHLG